MGSIGVWQILIILLIAVILFGSRKLPEIGSGLGKAIKNFKKATSEPDEIDITGSRQQPAQQAQQNTQQATTQQAQAAPQKETEKV